MLALAVLRKRRFLDAGVAGDVARWAREAEGERRLARAEGVRGWGMLVGERGVMPAEGGGRQATKASMSQNVDRERRVPLPLIHGFVDNCASPEVDRVARNTWK